MRRKVCNHNPDSVVRTQFKVSKQLKKFLRFTIRLAMFLKIAQVDRASVLLGEKAVKSRAMDLSGVFWRVGFFSN